MKKIVQIFLVCFIMINQIAFAQIELEFEDSNGIYGIVKLSSSGYKYIDYSALSPNYFGYPGTAGPGIHIRNLDGSLFRTLTLPEPVDSGYTEFIQPFYISETLFDTDSTNIEYLISYYFEDENLIWQRRTMIVDEEGTVLLSEQFAQTYEVFTSERYYYSVYETDEGTKLQLFYMKSEQFGNGQYLGKKVFSLPGNYPSGIKAPKLPNLNIESLLFPNPSAGNINIKLDLPDVISSAMLVFYNQIGQLIKQVKINPKDKLFKIDNTLLTPGIYFYQVITTPQTKVENKKMVIVR